MRGGCLCVCECVCVGVCVCGCVRWCQVEAGVEAEERKEGTSGMLPLPPSLSLPSLPLPPSFLLQSAARHGSVLFLLWPRTTYGAFYSQYSKATRVYEERGVSDAV